MSRKKVYITCNWGESPRQLINQYRKQTPNCDGVWGSFELVETVNDADCILMMDGSSANEIFPPDKRTIFFGREPAHVSLNLPHSKNVEVYHHHIGNSWVASTWWLGLDYNQLKSMSHRIISEQKIKDLSVIESGKTMLPMHERRRKLIESIAAMHPSSIDVFGHITSTVSGEAYKHSLPHKSKEKGLIPYRYSLVIENGSADFYFSEKFIDPLLCWTMPIYWGCKNINSFFPEGSYRWIDINSPHAIEEIVEISKSDYYEKNIEQISKARSLILEKYNLFPTIEKALNEGRII